jgi:hypothetical protein
MTDAQMESSEQVEQVEVDQPKRGRRAARAERKAQRQERKRQSTVKTSAIISMITQTPSTNREEAEREAAEAVDQALAPSMDLLRAAVPDSSSPEEAWRTIESKLGREVRDPDPQLPNHPVYSGDALVYKQLQRHYGRTSPAGSFRQGWSRGQSLPPMLGG